MRAVISPTRTSPSANLAGRGAFEGGDPVARDLDRRPRTFSLARTWAAPTRRRRSSASANLDKHQNSRSAMLRYATFTEGQGRASRRASPAPTPRSASDRGDRHRVELRAARLGYADLSNARLLRCDFTAADPQPREPPRRQSVRDQVDAIWADAALTWRAAERRSARGGAATGPASPPGRDHRNGRRRDEGSNSTFVERGPGVGRQSPCAGAKRTRLARASSPAVRGAAGDVSPRHGARGDRGDGDALPYAAREVGDVLLRHRRRAEAFRHRSSRRPRQDLGSPVEGACRLRAVGGPPRARRRRGCRLRGPSEESRSTRTSSTWSRPRRGRDLRVLFQRVTEVLHIHAREEISMVDDGVVQAGEDGRRIQDGGDGQPSDGNEIHLG